MKKPISYRDKRVLIIDDLADMRNSLRSQMSALEITQVNVVATVREALDLLSHRQFDVILCDYYLGGSTDGQQFLEYLRIDNLIKRSVIFIMITAETGYSSIITAAECLPDDYLLKPFTAETLRLRFERLVEKKIRLQKIDHFYDLADWSEVTNACDEVIRQQDRYLLDAMRIKGHALLMADRGKDAIGFYEEVLSHRRLPWARLGLARANKAEGEFAIAKQILNELIIDTPQLLSSYDLLGKIYNDCGDTENAMTILEKASDIAPNSLKRQRSIVELAERTGDFKRVESILTSVVKKTKNSPLRNASDYAKLSNAYLEQHDIQKAAATIDEGKTFFKESANMRALSAVEAQVMHKLGKRDLAVQALQQAMEGGTNGISDDLALTIAKACLVNGETAQAANMMKHLLQNNPESEVIIKAISHVYKDYGGEEATKALIEQSAQEVVKLNNDAVLKAKAGAYSEAASMLTDAALRLPNNLHILANACLALLVDVLMNEFDLDKIEQSKLFINTIRKTNKDHPKLKEIAQFQLKIQTKYSLESIL